MPSRAHYKHGRNKCPFFGEKSMCFLGGPKGRGNLLYLGRESVYVRVIASLGS
jgi:hypothetical protein